VPAGQRDGRGRADTSTSEPPARDASAGWCPALEGRDLREQLATKPVSQYSEASAVAVVETQALPGEPSFKNVILLPQERDDVSLLTLEPATQSSYEQLKRKHR
jgi:hypothetical protein